MTKNTKMKPFGLLSSSECEFDLIIEIGGLECAVYCSQSRGMANAWRAKMAATSGQEELGSKTGFSTLISSYCERVKMRFLLRPLHSMER